MVTQFACFRVMLLLLMTNCETFVVRLEISMCGMSGWNEK